MHVNNTLAVAFGTLSHYITTGNLQLEKNLLSKILQGS
jgi:hypothetical protein